MTLDDLITVVEATGFTVHWAQLSRSSGYYDATTKTIWLANSLDSTPRFAISVLAHEFAHALEGHDGPQPMAVERRCDEIAARIIIDPEAYAEAERLHGGYNKAALAEELGVASFIVSAYRRAMEKAA